jgi:hypothetical protein
MNRTLKDVITLSVLAGLGLAVLANPNGAVQLIQSVAGGWFSVVRTSAGQPSQLRGTQR